MRDSCDSAVEFTATAGTTYLIAVDSALWRHRHLHPSPEWSTRPTTSFAIPPRCSRRLDRSRRDIHDFTDMCATKQAASPITPAIPAATPSGSRGLPRPAVRVAISTCTYERGSRTLLGVYTGSSVDTLSSGRGQQTTPVTALLRLLRQRSRFSRRRRHRPTGSRSTRKDGSRKQFQPAASKDLRPTTPSPLLSR